MDLSSDIYERVGRRMHARFGGAAVVWWEKLPGVLVELSGRWGLTIDVPVRQGNTALVLRCVRFDGSIAMLKLTPDPSLTAAENAVLSAWASSGRVPAVWAWDEALGALLLAVTALPQSPPCAPHRW